MAMTKQTKPSKAKLSLVGHKAQQQQQQQWQLVK